MATALAAAVGGGRGGGGSSRRAIGGGMDPTVPIKTVFVDVDWVGCGGSYDGGGAGCAGRGVGRCGGGAVGFGPSWIPSLLAYSNNLLCFVGSFSFINCWKFLVMGGCSNPLLSAGRVDVS